LPPVAFLSARPTPAAGVLRACFPSRAHRPCAQDEVNELIHAADASISNSGGCSVRLPDEVLPSGKVKRFEVRLGTAAVSRCMPHSCSSRMIQVCLDNGNTQMVTHVGRSAPRRALPSLEAEPEPEPELAEPELEQEQFEQPAAELALRLEPVEDEDDEDDEDYEIETGPAATTATPKQLSAIFERVLAATQRPAEGLSGQEFVGALYTDPDFARVLGLHEGRLTKHPSHVLPEDARRDLKLAEAAKLAAFHANEFDALPGLQQEVDRLAAQFQQVAQLPPAVPQTPIDIVVSVMFRAGRLFDLMDVDKDDAVYIEEFLAPFAPKEVPKEVPEAVPPPQVALTPAAARAQAGVAQADARHDALDAAAREIVFHQHGYPTRRTRFDGDVEEKYMMLCYPDGKTKHRRSFWIEQADEIEMLQRSTSGKSNQQFLCWSNYTKDQEPGMMQTAKRIKR
jgi:hypothetical protein